MHKIKFLISVIPYKIWLGGPQFYGSAIFCKGNVYIFIVSKELAKSGDSQDFYLNLWIEKSPRDYVNMVYIDIIGKY